MFQFSRTEYDSLNMRIYSKLLLLIITLDFKNIY